MLLSSGLLDLTVEGSRGRLWLTDVGKGVVGRVREIDGLMSAQKPGDQRVPRNRAVPSRGGPTFLLFSQVVV